MAIPIVTTAVDKPTVTTVMEWPVNGLGDTTATLLLLFGLQTMFLYSVSSVFAGAFGVALTAVFPYEHSEFGFDDGEGQARWLAVVTTWVLTATLMGVAFRSVVRPWDHLMSLSVLYFAVCCGATGRAPTSMTWWVTMVVLTAAVLPIPPRVTRWCIGFGGREKDP